MTVLQTMPKANLKNNHDINKMHIKICFPDKDTQ